MLTFHYFFSNMDSQYLHEVVITAIVVKDGKYLVMRRSLDKKRFPGMWTVPGGRLETNDYVNSPKEAKDYWYNVLEKTLRREVKEEAGIEIDNITYVTSLATVHGDGAPSIVISCAADYVSGDVTLQPGETTEYAWVNLEEARQINLISGICEELELADKKLRGIKTEWTKA